MTAPENVPALGEEPNIDEALELMEDALRDWKRGRLCQTEKHRMALREIREEWNALRELLREAQEENEEFALALNEEHGKLFAAEQALQEAQRSRTQWKDKANDDAAALRESRRETEQRIDERDVAEARAARLGREVERLRERYLETAAALYAQRNSVSLEQAQRMAAQDVEYIRCAALAPEPEGDQ